ncbi:MAG: hypothetical protein KGK18_12760, partial [Burkholderiales bacterium]|nr:hypothetical protein [Burkholderiales bacterium]
MSLLSSSIGLGALALPLLLVGVTALVLIATVVVLWRSRPKAPTSTSGGNPALAGPGTAASTNADAVSGRLAAIVESS